MLCNALTPFRSLPALALTILAALTCPLLAQDTPETPDTPETLPVEATPAGPEELTKRLGLTWDDGPRTCDLGPAQINITADYTFLDADDSRTLMVAYGNTPTHIEQGLVAQKSDPYDWFVIFEFEDIGYIKDAASEKIDADAILASYQEGDRPDLKTIGWNIPPRYDPATNNLEWCIEFDSDGMRVLNHNIRVLGRGGVMRVTLVCDPAQLTDALPKTHAMLANFAYKPGNTYAEWQPGDKIAEYGLTALVAGGAIAVAAKSGLLGKLIKPLVIGGAIVIGGLAKFGKKLFGRSDA